jgi:hypothetical protein
VTFEVGDRTIDATTSVVEGPGRARLWDRHVAPLPWFAEYPALAGRTMPVIRLSPRGTPRT